MVWVRTTKRYNVRYDAGTYSTGTGCTSTQRHLFLYCDFVYVCHQHQKIARLCAVAANTNCSTNINWNLKNVKIAISSRDTCLQS
jgi:hypothetical protein